MTASQMADGSQTLRIRLVDEINRENTFYRFSAISTASSIYAELLVVLWPDNDPESAHARGGTTVTPATAVADESQS